MPEVRATAKDKNWETALEWKTKNTNNILPSKPKNVTGLMNILRIEWGNLVSFSFDTFSLHRLSIFKESLCTLVLWLEWFSFECRKTKTKVITLANHIGHRQYIEPIKTRSNYMWLTQSAGKCMRARHNWLWFYFWLDEKVARIF